MAFRSISNFRSGWRVSDKSYLFTMEYEPNLLSMKLAHNSTTLFVPQIRGKGDRACTGFRLPGCLWHLYPSSICLTVCLKYKRERERERDRQTDRQTEIENACVLNDTTHMNAENFVVKLKF